MSLSPIAYTKTSLGIKGIIDKIKILVIDKDELTFLLILSKVSFFTNLITMFLPKIREI